MRVSPLRHTLAVLRTSLGLGQKEMGELVRCSKPTIQAVELGKLQLSQDLATRIQIATGADVGWLLRNDVTAPPIQINGEAFTRESFENHRAQVENPDVTIGRSM